MVALSRAKTYVACCVRFEGVWLEKIAAPYRRKIFRIPQDDDGSLGYGGHCARFARAVGVERY
jgi:hypothetical protein